MPTFTLELFRVEELNRGDIGLTQYPIFDEEYRAGLNKKIRDHYYNREIGLETIGMFVFNMRRRMNEIMPYYNSLYESERLTFDPLRTVDLKTLATGEATTIAEGTSTADTASDNESGSRAVQSTTPQVMLSGNGDYATSGADTTSKSLSTGTSTEASESSNTSEQSNDSHTTGYQGSPSQLLMEFRATLMNIDMLVIDELSDLFMGVWDNGDDFKPYPFTELPML